MTENTENNESQTDSENSESGSSRRSARPLGNRFPKDPTLIAALRKHEKEWQAILASLSNSFGVSVNSLGTTLGR